MQFVLFVLNYNLYVFQSKKTIKRNLLNKGKRDQTKKVCESIEVNMQNTIGCPVEDLETSSAHH